MTLPTFTIPHTHDQNTLRAERVEVVQANLSLPLEETMRLLKCKRVVSRHYSDRCLLVDRWHVGRRENGVKRPCFVSDDPVKTIWFHIVLMAMVDVRAGRPCDCGMWIKDLPPGGEREKCTMASHICKDDALAFLDGLSDVEWKCAGLTRDALKLALK